MMNIRVFFDKSKMPEALILGKFETLFYAAYPLKSGSKTQHQKLLCFNLFKVLIELQFLLDPKLRCVLSYERRYVLVN